MDTAQFLALLAANLLMIGGATVIIIREVRRARNESQHILRAQYDEQDIFYARRMVEALNTLPECDQCRERIEYMRVDRRKLWAPALKGSPDRQRPGGGSVA